ncbi:MAG: hypothetical protein GXO96_06355 [Nitrospirae bacterium]|nr:hypothetical protein [Candidatus Manganitrophaceae bacterium]
MFRIRRGLILLMIFTLAFAPQYGFSKVLSKEEVNAKWEDLLRKEQYRPTVAPNHDNVIIVHEQGEAYLLGFFGLSSGGGWRIGGRLQAEIQIQEGLLQLYSRGSTKWSPGFGFPIIGIEPRYNRKKYPIWEFRLILRNLARREEIHTIKTIPVPTQEVLQHPQFRFNPDDPPCPLGYWCPRGELKYEATQKIAIVNILGTLNPFRVDIPLAELEMSKGKK